MTEVAGPLAPPERFSSLPIRGAGAASTAGTDRSGLEVSCSMAQSVRNPHGKPDSDRASTPDGATAASQTLLSRSPFPGLARPAGRISKGNMGWARPRRKHAGIERRGPRLDRFLAQSYPSHVNQTIRL